MDEENMKDEENTIENTSSPTSQTPKKKPEVPEPKPENVIPNLESLSGFDPMATLQSETITESNPVSREGRIETSQSTQGGTVEQQSSISPPPTPSPEVLPEQEFEKALVKGVAEAAEASLMQDKSPVEESCVHKWTKITPDFEAVCERCGINKSALKIVDENKVSDELICSKIRFFCTEHNVALVMKALCERVPEALPNYRTWAIADPIPVIHDKIQAAGYVEKKLPVLRLMLTTNLGNVPWTARVLIAMAVYGAIQELVDA